MVGNERMWASESGTHWHESQLWHLIGNGTLVSYSISLSLNSLISEECYQEHLSLLVL